ncbi:hypothetical protein ACSFBI_33165 [Variovorax sp. RB3P1]|uniref:hypothetical protein n=1 Tax=Variovorax sp. RB3P1 TaxID=3443732 RepID=UPI003F458CCC
MEPSNAFRSLLSVRWFAAMRDLPVADDLRKVLASPTSPMNELEFRAQLADAIQNRRFSAEDYESLIDLDFETADEVSTDLMQLWVLMYPDQPVSG